MSVNYAIISLFAIYGLICLFVNVFKIIGRRKYLVESVNMVLLVFNQEQKIEGIVKEAMESRYVRNIAVNGRFTIIDMNSNDDTLKILRRLENQYPLIEVCPFDERERIFK